MTVTSEWICGFWSLRLVVTSSFIFFSSSLGPNIFNLRCVLVNKNYKLVWILIYIKQSACISLGVIRYVLGMESQVTCQTTGLIQATKELALVECRTGAETYKSY